MALYIKNGKSSRNGRTRRPQFNNRNGKMNIPLQLKNLQRKVGRLEQKSEDKFIQEAHDFSGLVNTSGWSVALCNGVVQGNTRITRIGQFIKMNHLEVSMYMTANATSVKNAIRVIFLLDMQQDGDNLTAANVVDGLAIESLYETDYQGRYKILYDKAFVVVQGAMNATLLQKENLTLVNKVNYGLGNAGTYADIVKYGLWIMVISDQATNGPDLFVNTRVWFHDD